MCKSMKCILVILLVGVVQAVGVVQTSAQNSAALLTDALCFRRAELTGRTRLDVYVSVPYSILQFSELNDQFASQYSVRVTLRDSMGRSVKDTSVTRSAVETNFQVTQGSTGKTDNTVLRFNIKPGTYRNEIVVTDKFSHRDYTSTDTLKVPDFADAPTLSSLMYVSQVEQKGDRYAITPFVGSSIWNGELKLFVFFEAYTDEIPLSVAFSWSLTALDGRTLGSGMGDVMSLTTRATQTFLPLSNIERALPGRYVLTVNMHPVTGGVPDTSLTLSSKTKPYIVPRSFAGSVLSDLTKAVKQLAYVAEQNEIDFIMGAANQADQQARFEDFWKRRDPTPTTLRNEAFDDYFARIETANKRFKSYIDGWRTDMGMVYVIFGEPANIERVMGQAGSVVGVRWTYQNGTAYFFEDNSGFGDFRLRIPLPNGVKYKFR